MAETVLYLLNSTDDTTRIAIQPRTFDGVGGVQRNTDLTLYGNGAPQWGERFDENFYHLLENFSVIQKATLPVAPRNENDLGTQGLGINRPIRGQLWYNRTDSKMYMYNGTSWYPTTAVSIVANMTSITNNTMVPNPRIGELSYSLDTGMMMIFLGAPTGWTPVIQATPPTRAINTAGSLTGGGTLAANRTLTLVNDSNNPGSMFYYGTNSAGTKGFHAFPAGGSVTSVAANVSGAGLTVTGSPITTSGVLTFSLNAELRGLAVLSSTGRMSRTGAGSYTTSPISYSEVVNALGFVPPTQARSITGIGSVTGGGNFTADRQIALVNDLTSPGATRYYGTNNAGTKGFWPLVTSGQYSHSARGYEVLPSGLTIQWGYAASGYVTWPIAYNVACFAAVCATNRDWAGSNGYNHVSELTRTYGKFLFDIQPNAGWWISIGV